MGSPSPTSKIEISVANVAAPKDEIETAPLRVEVKTISEPAPDKVDLAGDLKAGKVMRHGVTVGLSYMMQTPLGSTGISASAMPYVAVFPGMAMTSRITREFCAASWSGEDAQKASDSKAVEEAIYFAAGDIGKKIKAACETEIRYCEVSTAKPASDPEACKKAKAKDPKTCQAYLTEYTSPKAETAWKLAVPGACDWTHFGFYFGLPFGFSSNVTLSGSSFRRAFTPFGSLGAIWSPSAYIGIMAGLTLSGVDRAAPKDEPTRSVVIPTFSAGIGGNIDVIGAVVPSK